MRHLFLAALLYAASLASWAQTAYNPAVAYVKLSGTTLQLFLANEDGSHAVMVYSTKKAIGAIDFAPSGDKIAFSQQDGLKLLPYTTTNAGIAVGPTSVLDTGSVGAIDFSPDGSKLIYVIQPAPNMPQQIRTLPVAGGAKTTLVTDTPGLSAINAVAWLRSGTSFVYTQGFASDLRTELRGASVDTFGNVVPWPLPILTTGGGFSEISELTSAHSREAVLVRLNGTYGVTLIECDVVTGGLTPRVPGLRGKFSSDDASIVFVDEGRNFVSRYTVGSGTTTTLTKRGEFGKIDARPPSPPPVP
jgi:dipeptidyl aminopeptidase/acylaminoacyl peptidase